MRFAIGWSRKSGCAPALLAAALAVPAEAVPPPPPVNDSFHRAVLLDVGAAAGTLAGATNDGSATLGMTGQPDVWYRYTAPAAGTLHVDTCGSSDAGGADTVLSLHSTVPGRTSNQLTANDDWGLGSDPTACTGSDVDPSSDSAVTQGVTPGQVIWIRVSQYDSASGGDGTFHLRLSIDVPTADGSASAVAVGLGTVSGSLAGATSDGSSTVGNGQPDVWYRYAASRAGTLYVDTCGSNAAGGLDSVLSLHSAAPGTTANQLTANDDGQVGADPTACESLDPQGRDSAVVRAVTPGETIWIRVSRSSTAAGGNGAFRLRVGLDNDSWQDAPALGLGSQVGTLANATLDGSSTQGWPGQPDVWYTYTAPSARWLYVDTCGSHDDSGFDSVVSLHTAGPGSFGNELVANDDWPSSSDPAPSYCAGSDIAPSYDSAVRYSMAAGQKIWIRVSTYDYEAGQTDFVLNLPEPGFGSTSIPGLALLAALRPSRRRRHGHGVG